MTTTEKLTHTEICRIVFESKPPARMTYLEAVAAMARELLAYRRATPADDLRAAVEALGAMPEGYCFCSRDRIGDDSKQHEPECADIRAALEAVSNPETLDWKNGEARSARGDLYEVRRLSEFVWQVLKNGTPFTGWYSRQHEARTAAQSDNNARAALSQNGGAA